MMMTVTMSMVDEARSRPEVRDDGAQIGTTGAGPGRPGRWRPGLGAWPGPDPDPTLARCPERVQTTRTTKSGASRDGDGAVGRQLAAARQTATANAAQMQQTATAANGGDDGARRRRRPGPHNDDDGRANGENSTATMTAKRQTTKRRRKQRWRTTTGPGPQARPSDPQTAAAAATGR